MKEEMTKLFDRMIAQTKKEVDENLKKVQEEFNNSTNFIQMSCYRAMRFFLLFSFHFHFVLTKVFHATFINIH